MHSQIVGLRVAAVAFAIVAPAQLARLIIRPEILVAGHLMPLWPSVVAVVVAGALCYWMWTLAVRIEKLKL